MMCMRCPRKIPKYLYEIGNTETVICLVDSNTIELPILSKILGAYKLMRPW